MAAEPLPVRMAGKGTAFFAVPGAASLSGDEKCVCDCACGLRGVASGSAVAEVNCGEANGTPRLLLDVAETGLSDVVHGRAGLLVALAGDAPMNCWWVCTCVGPPAAGKAPK